MTNSDNGYGSDSVHHRRIAPPRDLETRTVPKPPVPSTTVLSPISPTVTTHICKIRNTGVSFEVGLVEMQEDISTKPEGHRCLSSRLGAHRCPSSMQVDHWRLSSRPEGHRCLSSRLGDHRCLSSTQEARRYLSSTLGDHRRCLLGLLRLSREVNKAPEEPLHRSAA
jgi:hypothetical protein